jgi:hypothetical protein
VLRVYVRKNRVSSPIGGLNALDKMKMNYINIPRSSICQALLAFLSKFIKVKLI